jgi:AbrB family looped-hinge helix DNA binding protein
MGRQATTVRLSSKGQIIIPAGVRQKLGLKTGQALTVRAGGRREIVFVPVEASSAGVGDMLRRTRAWAALARRDLVEELHRRRQAERGHESV